MWSAYISGAVDRQDFWACALNWVSKGNVGEYMSKHRMDNNITGVKTHFDTVISWVSGVFTDVVPEMKGIEWGRLYETYGRQPYNPANVAENLRKLMADPFIRNPRGIFEFILGGAKETQLLGIRLFDEATKRVKYSAQTQVAEAKNHSNCSLCSIGVGDNKTKIWNQSEMDADHASPWSQGGATTADNCEMLCKTHNRAKGNR